MGVRRLILFVMLVALAGSSASGPGARAQPANDTWRWQQQQRALDEQRRQQEMMRQEQQRQRQQEMQRQQMEQARRQQEMQRQQMEQARRQQEVQRQQMEQARRQQEQFRRQGASDQNRLQQQSRNAGALAAAQRSRASSPGSLSTTKTVAARQEAARKVADLAKPPTLAEIKRAFRGQFAPDGRAVVRVKGRTMLVNASLVGRRPPIRAGVGAITGAQTKGPAGMGASSPPPPSPPSLSDGGGRGGGGSSFDASQPARGLTPIVSLTAAGANFSGNETRQRRVAYVISGRAARRHFTDPNGAWNLTYLNSAPGKPLKEALGEFDSKDHRRGKSVKGVDLSGLTIEEMQRTAKAKGFRLVDKPPSFTMLRAFGNFEQGSPCYKARKCYRLANGGVTPNWNDPGVVRHFMYVHPDGGVIRIKPSGEPRPDGEFSRKAPHASKSVLLDMSILRNGSDEVDIELLAKLDEDTLDKLTGFPNEAFKVSNDGTPVPKAQNEPETRRDLANPNVKATNLNAYHLGSSKERKPIFDRFGDALANFSHTNARTE